MRVEDRIIDREAWTSARNSDVWVERRRGPGLPGIFAFVGFLGSALGWTLPLPALEGTPDFEVSGVQGSPLTLEAEAGGGLLLVGSGSVGPPEYLRFLEATGVPWRAAWDRALASPRFSRPLSRVAIAPDGPSSSGLSREEVLGFISRHSDYFGIGPEDLFGAELLPFGSGWLFSALQGHGGLPVRGSAFRLRIGEDRGIIYASSRVARGLPDLEASTIVESEIEAIARGLGLPNVVSSSLQVVFPRGNDEPRPAWALISDFPEEGEVETIVDAVTGALLSSAPAWLAFDGPCEARTLIWGTIEGCSPDPENFYATPADYGDAERWPLGGVGVTLEPHGWPCPVFDPDRRVIVEEFGGFAFVPFAPEEVPEFDLLFDLGGDSFVLWDGYAPYLPVRRSGSGVFGGNLVLNLDEQGYNDKEERSFQLHVTQHIQRADRKARYLSEVLRLPFLYGEEDFRPRVTLFERKYIFRYNPFARTLVLSNDCAVPVLNKDVRRIVPTIVYHEYGQHWTCGMALAWGDEDVLEGVADAFSACEARIPRVGYYDAFSATAWCKAACPDIRDCIVCVEKRHSVDLERVTAYPGSAREAVGGAFWELVDDTPDPEEPEEAQSVGCREGRSTFAFDVLVAWVASRRVKDGPAYRSGSFDYTPYLGEEILAESEAHSRSDASYLRELPHHREVLRRSLLRRNLLQLSFVRGDANSDGRLDISDALTTLGYLFLGEDEPPCARATDANADGRVDLSDPVLVLGVLFLGVEGLDGTCTLERPRDGAVLGCLESACP